MNPVKDYWIKALQDLAEFDALAGSEDLELSAVRDEVANVLDDQFIAIATEAGIVIRESMLGIQPFADETLDDRRAALLQRFQNPLPYTHRQLDARLQRIAGVGGYTLVFNYNSYSLTVTVNLGNKRQFAEVDRISRLITPANLLLTVTLGYNRNIDLAQFTHAELAAYTHLELREEILP